MHRLRLTVIIATLVAALFMGSGVASAGLIWCEVGSPPPMDTQLASGSMLAPRPDNGQLMPSPVSKQPNDKFTVNPVVLAQQGQTVYLPPGMTQASQVVKK